MSAASSDVSKYLNQFNLNGKWEQKEGETLTSQPMDPSTAKIIANNIELDLSNFLQTRNLDPALSKGICRPEKKGLVARKGYLTVDGRKLAKLLNGDSEKSENQQVKVLKDTQPLRIRSKRIKERDINQLALQSTTQLSNDYQTAPTHNTQSLRGTKRKSSELSVQILSQQLILPPQLKSETKRMSEMSTSKCSLSIGMSCTPGKQTSYFERVYEVNVNGLIYKIPVIALIDDDQEREMIDTYLEENLCQALKECTSLEGMYDTINLLLKSKTFKFLTSSLTLTLVFENKLWILNLKGNKALLSQKNEKYIPLGVTSNDFSLECLFLDQFTTGTNVLTLASKNLWSLSGNIAVIHKQVEMLANVPESSEQIAQFLVDVYSANKDNKFAVVVIKLSK